MESNEYLALRNVCWLCLAVISGLEVPMMLTQYPDDPYMALS